jgi:hypothetical protein
VQLPATFALLPGMPAQPARPTLRIAAGIAVFNSVVRVMMRYSQKIRLILQMRAKRLFRGIAQSIGSTSTRVCGVPNIACAKSVTTDD